MNRLTPKLPKLKWIPGNTILTLREAVALLVGARTMTVSPKEDKVPDDIQQACDAIDAILSRMAAKSFNHYARAITLTMLTHANNLADSIVVNGGEQHLSRIINVGHEFMIDNAESGRRYIYPVASQEAATARETALQQWGMDDKPQRFSAK